MAPTPPPTDAKVAQDERLTLFLKWLVGISSGLTLLGIAGVITLLFSLRDNQQAIKTQLDYLAANVNQLSSANEDLKQSMHELRDRLSKVEVRVQVLSFDKLVAYSNSK